MTAITPRIAELRTPPRTYGVWLTPEKETSEKPKNQRSYRKNNPNEKERLACRVATAPLDTKVSNAEIWRNFRKLDCTYHPGNQNLQTRPVRQEWNSDFKVWWPLPNRVCL